MDKELLIEKLTDAHASALANAMEDVLSDLTVDVDQELQDLLKIYTDNETLLNIKVVANLSYLDIYMKRYLDSNDELRKTKQKIADLKYKMKKPGDE